MSNNFKTVIALLMTGLNLIVVVTTIYAIVAVWGVAAITAMATTAVVGLVATFATRGEVAANFNGALMLLWSVLGMIATYAINPWITVGCGLVLAATSALLYLDLKYSEPTRAPMAVRITRGK